MRHPEYSGQFKRDLKRAKKRGQNMEKIKAPMQLLIDEKSLPVSYGDHPAGSGSCLCETASPEVILFVDVNWK